MSTEDFDLNNEDSTTSVSATASMSSTNIELASRPRLVRRAPRTYPDMSCTLQSDAAHAASSPTIAATRQPLIHRTNIFGPGLHNDRQRPRHSTTANGQSHKENAVHHLSDDEYESAPVKKKSRKEAAARSIVNIASERIPVLELVYQYIRLHVLTDEIKTWLQGRAELALFVQQGFDWAVKRLGLDPHNFGPVTHMEHNLCCERIYGTRGDFKELARIIVAGPDGYEFLPCSSKATKEEQDRIAAANRDLVAELTTKSAFVFENPRDRTVKNSMSKHASIETLIQTALFAGLLSDGMQYPEFFDDTLPLGEQDDAQPSHKPHCRWSPSMSASPRLQIRAAIMEYSSGHYVPEAFARKIFKPHFNAELATLRAWRTFTSSPTVIPGDGPVRTTPATFLTRTLQEKIFADARYNVLKDVVAPVPSTEVMNTLDFALHQ
ncbi:hypothetical protein DFH08DRAFT_972992 [Mycena albidolilacea]|uniref:DUF6532 domain-containing protein n=1 Tax=Mycena albidolilacea TaxID=1033008 RepID=A0AAD6ZAZ5_9AGAR|nr:hypothetical protein DFH08DRAFT_972992 [Mycena albidolilacea]